MPPYTTITPTYNTILDRTLHFSRHNIPLDAALTPRVADVGFVTPIKEVRCYEAQIEESEKRPAAAGSRTQDTSGLSRQ